MIQKDLLSHSIKFNQTIDSIEQHLTKCTIADRLSDLCNRISHLNQVFFYPKQGNECPLYRHSTGSYLHIAIQFLTSKNYKHYLQSQSVQDRGFGVRPS